MTGRSRHDEPPVFEPYYKSAEQCPDRAKHTPDPPGYLAWHAWAEKKARTHDQFQCPTCGFWAIWKRKAKA